MHALENTQHPFISTVIDPTRRRTEATRGAGYVQEVLTHGWDLARATGQETERDPELVTWALVTAKRILPPDIRGDAGVPFGPVVEVSPDAAPYAQLAAWLGRHP